MSIQESLFFNRVFNQNGAVTLYLDEVREDPLIEIMRNEWNDKSILAIRISTLDNLKGTSVNESQT